MSYDAPYELTKIAELIRDLERTAERDRNYALKSCKEINDLKEKCKGLSETVVEQKAAIDELKAKLKTVEASPEDVWFYDPMGDNDSQSLTCPVVMTADKTPGIRKQSQGT